MRIQNLLQQLPSVAWLPVLLIIILVLVAAHEYGHYLFARIFKMGIEEFAIGFGKRPLWVIGKKRVGIKLNPEQIQQFQWREAHGGDEQEKTLPFEGRGGVEPHEELVGDMLYQDTTFTIRPWPLGGFVRIKGMMPEEDGSEVKIPGGFYSKPPWQRFLVLFAGPLFSVLAGVIVLAGVYFFAGRQEIVYDAVLGPVVEEQPAAQAGLKEGDRIVSLDGQPVQSFYDVVRKVRDGGARTHSVTYERGGVQATTQLTPVIDKTPTNILGPKLEVMPERKIQAKIGVRPATRKVRMGLAAALTESVKVPWIVVTGVLGMFAAPSTFSQNVGGPASMAMATQDSIKQGVDVVIGLAAILSISVGILNLLPVPPLDGGQMLMAFVEMLRGGRRLSIQVQGTLAAIGMTLVGMLIFAVLFVDVSRLTHYGEKPTASAPAPKGQGTGHPNSNR